MLINKIVTAVAVLCLLLHDSCKKSNFPDAEIILQYESTQGNYNQSCVYSEGAGNFFLIPRSSVAYSTVPTSDSVLIYYGSTIHQQDNMPRVDIKIAKWYLKSHLDSSNGRWYPKIGSDFYNVFNTGEVGISNSSNSYQGLTILFSGADSSANYVLTSDIPNNYIFPIQSYLDTSNYFKIVKTNEHFNWDPLYLNGFTSITHSRNILVTINFKCKLYNLNAPHDSLVVRNGVYQGIFIDRN